MPAPGVVFVSPQVSNLTPHYINTKNRIRIVSLPKGCDHANGVIDLVQNVLGLGRVGSVCINDNKNKNKKFSCATVDMKTWNTGSQNTCSLLNALQVLPYNTTVKVFTSFQQFQWLNGAPMKHLSIQLLEEEEEEEEYQEEEFLPLLSLPADAWTSLHIPVLPNDMCIDGKPFGPSDLQDFIENKMCIGTVKRIDFVERDDMVQTANGQIRHLEEGELADDEQGEKPITAAFIHMQNWYSTNITNAMRHTLDKHGQYHIRGYYGPDNYNDFRAFYQQSDNGTQKTKYFVFKINHRPIPDADDKLNIHQLAAIKTKQDAEIEALKQKVLKMEQELQNSSLVIDDLHDMVWGTLPHDEEVEIIKPILEEVSL